MTLDAHVGELVREVAAALIMPRYRALATHEIERKAGGEVVTLVDREVEAWLGARLSAALPGSRVVGEEATALDAGLLDRLGHGALWLIDPVDGTANFVAGHGAFAVMVALVVDGTTEAAWIYDPVRARLYHAARGAGAWCDGQPMRVPGDASATAAGLRGAIFDRHLPPALKGRIKAGIGAVGRVPGLYCTGAEYPAIIGGDRDFALYWRTLPWDHAPGALLLQEAGGVACHLDGSPYAVADQRPGLLIARSPQVWRCVHEALVT